MGCPGHRPCAHHQLLSRPGEGAMRQGGAGSDRGHRAACPWGNRSHWGHRGTREVQVTALAVGCLRSLSEEGFQHMTKVINLFRPPQATAEKVMDETDSR